MAQSFWQKLAKKVDKNLIGEGLGTAEFSGYIDTGSYSLNLLASGTLFGGIPDNSFVGLAGETTTGKTFFALGISQNFLGKNDNSGVIYADSESAIHKAMLEGRDIDGMRIIQLEPATVEDFRTQMLQTIEGYEAFEERPPMMAVLDSLGALSTNKELEDTATFGETKEAQKKRETKDMTRAPLLKGTFRVLRLKMAKLKIPMIITNHLYANIGGYGSQKEMSGGSGLKYAADAIWHLTKSKAKEGDDTSGMVIGSKITVTAVKSRHARENARVEVLLNYDTGLDPYYGLIDIALQTGVFKKLPKGIELPDGTKVSRKDILRTPADIYTDQVLDLIDRAAKPLFTYGVGENPNYVSPENETEE